MITATDTTVFMNIKSTVLLLLLQKQFI